ncbi:MAG TPA: STAS/SEC14 domain-containing protein [Sphingomicrobium sp.]|nr:STAS/SEC14 domain-containing protein [Sphingomicrobium sp.]
MIQVIEGLPDNVVGIVAKGRITNEDCKTILKPLFEKSLKRHDKVRLYYQIGCRFPGAAWEDLRLGIENLPQWERVAVVTDAGWVRHTVNALRFLIAAEVRVFSTSDAYEGCAWISSR